MLVIGIGDSSNGVYNSGWPRHAYSPYALLSVAVAVVTAACRLCLLFLRPVNYMGPKEFFTVTAARALLVRSCGETRKHTHTIQTEVEPMTSN